MDQYLVLDNGLDHGIPEIDAIQGENTEKITEKLSVGQKLYQARRNLSDIDLEKISSELCIRPHLLKALERDDFNEFPSACYAVGFLKNYATYLGLNVNQIVSQYKKEFNGSTKKVDLVFLEVDTNRNYAQHLIVAMVILSALILYGVWYSSSNHSGMSVSSLPDVSEVTSNILVSATEKDQDTVEKTVVAEIQPPIVPKADATEENTGFQLVQQASATPLAAKVKTTAVVADQVRLTVHEDTWVRIVGPDSEILVDRVLLAGEEFYMTNREGMKLMTSNAGAVAIFVGNVAVAPLGKAGEIRENISLDRRDLLQKTVHLSY